MTKYGWILNAVMGFALMVAGSWLVYAEVKTPPLHSSHLYVGVGVALLGALLINPTPIITSIKQVVVVIAPIIPFSKLRPSGSVTPPPDGDLK